MEVGLSGTNASSNSSETNEYSREWENDKWSAMERAFQQQVGLGDKEAELLDSVEGGLQQRAGFDDKEAELPDSVEGGLQQRAGLDDKEAELPDTVERASMEIECSSSSLMSLQEKGKVVMDLTTGASAPTPISEEKTSNSQQQQQQPQHKQQQKNKRETEDEMQCESGERKW